MKEVVMSQEPAVTATDRFVRPLPPNPNLGKQRKLAKTLGRDYWRGDPDAVERVRALHRSLRRRTLSP
jgi:hypothetical protein